LPGPRVAGRRLFGNDHDAGGAALRVRAGRGGLDAQVLLVHSKNRNGQSRARESFSPVKAAEASAAIVFPELPRIVAATIAASLRQAEINPHTLLENLMTQSFMSVPS